MPGKRKIIVFGAGPHARGLLVPSLLATNRCELTAWIDPAEEARGLAGELFPAAPMASEIDLAGVPSETLAVIASPVTTHRAVFAAAYAHGLDCFIEKPLAATYADALAMCAKLRQGGPRATVGLWMRHSPLVLSLRRLLPRPLASQHEVSLPWVPDGNRSRVLDTFIYLIDMALNTHAGLPADIRMLRGEPPDCEVRFTDSSRARLVWRDATPATKEEKWHFVWHDGEHTAAIQGLTRLEVRAGGGAEVYAERGDYGAGFRYQLEQLLDGNFLVPLPSATRGHLLFDTLMEGSADRETPRKGV